MLEHGSWCERRLRNTCGLYARDDRPLIVCCNDVSPFAAPSFVIEPRLVSYGGAEIPGYIVPGTIHGCQSYPSLCDLTLLIQLPLPVIPERKPENTMPQKQARDATDLNLSSSKSNSRIEAADCSENAESFYTSNMPPNSRNIRYESGSVKGVKLPTGLILYFPHNGSEHSSSSTKINYGDNDTIGGSKTSSPRLLQPSVTNDKLNTSFDTDLREERADTEQTSAQVGSNSTRSPIFILRFGESVDQLSGERRREYEQGKSAYNDEMTVSSIQLQSLTPTEDAGANEETKAIHSGMTYKEFIQELAFEESDVMGGESGLDRGSHRRVTIAGTTNGARGTIHISFNPD